MQNMNSDVMQQWWTHTQPFQQGKGWIVLFCFVWFVASEKRGKWELLNHYRIIMNIADQNALQERSHNTHKVNILEKHCDSAMKNCSAP